MSGKPWYTGLMKSKTEKRFDKIVKKIKNTDDWRDYDLYLEENPVLVTMKDKDGKTLLIHAAESDSPDAMRIMIEDHNADVTVKDNAGKTAYDYAAEKFDKELKYIMDRYKDYPADLAREKKAVEENRDFFLKVIRDAEAKKTATTVEPLTRVSKDISAIGGPIPAVGSVAEFLTGKKGDPKAQLSQAKTQLGKGRKTRKLRRGKGKGKSRRRV